MEESRSHTALVHFQNRRVPNVRDPLTAIFMGHEGCLHVSAAGPNAWLTSDWLTNFTAPLPPGGGLVAFRQTPNQISVVFHGDGDQLHVAWRGRGRATWEGPVQIANHRPLHGPTSLGLGHLKPDSWFVIYCTQSGSVDSLRVDGGHPWQSAQEACPNGSAQPGGAVAVFNQVPDILTVAYVDKQSEFIHVTWRGVGANDWEGPALIHPEQTKVPPGAALAPVEFLANDWFVLFVDRAEHLRAARVRGLNPWEPPFAVTARPTAPAGAGIAALQHRRGDVSAYLVNHDGAVCEFRATEGTFGWGGPRPLTPPGVARPGASIFAAKQSEGITLLTFPGIDGRPHIAWQVASDPWKGPARISWFRVVPPYVKDGGQATGPSLQLNHLRTPPTSVTRVPGSAEHVCQLTGSGTRNSLSHAGAKGVDLGANTIHDGKTFIFFGDTTLPDVPPSEWNRNLDPGTHPPWDADLVAFSEAERLDADGFGLSIVTNEGQYFPFTMDRLGVLGNAETPTGAFSYDGWCYVFSVAYSHRVRSFLARSDRPELGRPFQLLYEFSTSRFFQVAPWVVRNAEFQGLPANHGDGLVMIAHGGIPEGFFLAWMPLERGKEPDKKRLLFYAGMLEGVIQWTPDETMAVPVFERPARGYTAVSLAWLECPGRFIVTYVNRWRQDEAKMPIVARLSRDLFQWSNEVTLFDPVEDEALKESLHWTDTPIEDRKSAAYGPFLLNKFHLWCPALRRATITFLMSTFQPYQVHVMRAQITINDVKPWTGFLCTLRDRVRTIRHFRR